MALLQVTGPNAAPDAAHAGLSSVNAQQPARAIFTSPVLSLTLCLELFVPQ